MESKLAEAKAKIKLIKKDILGSMPNEIQSFGKRAVVHTLNRTWDYFPAQAEEVAEKVFFRPKHYRPSESEVKWQKRAQTFKVILPKSHKEVIGMKWGKGPCIFFTHGWAGRGTQFCQFLPSLLQKGFSVVAFDAPSHGQSPGFMTNAFEILEAAESVVNVVGEIYAFVGHSFGCCFSLSLANSLKIKQIVLFAPNYDVEEDFKKWAKQEGVREEFFEATISGLEAKYKRSFKDFNPCTVGPEVEGHVLIFHDEDDRASKVENSKALCKVIPKSLLKISHGLGHNKILRDNKTIREVSAFLSNSKNADNRTKKVSI